MKLLGHKFLFYFNGYLDIFQIKHFKMTWVCLKQISSPCIFIWEEILCSKVPFYVIQKETVFNLESSQNFQGNT